MDAFAVSIAAGLQLSTITKRQVFRLSWHFGLFQFFMPILGWLLGAKFKSHITAYDHWVAFGLLGFIGGKMLWDALFGHEDGGPKKDPTRGKTLVMLSVATSIDALAVGLTLAVLGWGVWLPCIIIGVVAAGMTIIGMHFGKRLGERWETIAEILGGVVLIGIGVKILLEHTVLP
jgi:putative Mn2+ efflux pump MntP